MSIDRPKIESDIAACHPRLGMSDGELASMIGAAERCVQHAADLLGELDRVMIALGRLAIKDTIEWSNYIHSRSGTSPDPRIGADYLAIGRAELERLETEASEQKKGESE